MSKGGWGSGFGSPRKDTIEGWEGEGERGGGAKLSQVISVHFVGLVSLHGGEDRIGVKLVPGDSSAVCGPCVSSWWGDVGVLKHVLGGISTVISLVFLHGGEGVDRCQTYAR